jgi:UDP-N-acetylglucosamine 2-epimerase (non-hydrolysing)/GDP/UDP-N,N'-diacetylbacillosamine 2-epimerase (hydrolysing)
LSHLHFTATASARARVIALGEDPSRVHQAGAASLDHLRRTKLMSRQELENALHVELRSPVILVGYHPVTVLRDTLAEADALFAALARVNEQLLFCYPNADAGSRSLIERTRSFAAGRPDANVFINLDPITYWSLLGQANVFVGNSSSGIIEAASFELPVVNVGMRQRGREHGANVLDAEPSVDSIFSSFERALNKSFRDGLRGMANPYGDGLASERIARILAETPIDEDFIVKRSRQT